MAESVFTRVRVAFTDKARKVARKTPEAFNKAITKGSFQQAMLFVSNSNKYNEPVPTAPEATSLPAIDRREDPSPSSPRLHVESLTVSNVAHTRAFEPRILDAFIAVQQPEPGCESSLRAKGVKSNRSRSVIRLAPQSFLEDDSDGEESTSLDNFEDETETANATFFRFTSSDPFSAPTPLPGLLASRSRLSHPSEIPTELLQQIRERDEHIRMLRLYTAGQRQELSDLREWAALQEDELEPPNSDTTRSQHEQAISATVADYWRKQSQHWEEQAGMRLADVAGLHAQLIAARASENAVRVALAAQRKQSPWTDI